MRGADRTIPESRAARADRLAGIATAEFAAVERLATFEIANAMLSMELDLQRHLGLRAEERQVFVAIAIATVQRFARAAAPGSPYLSSEPLDRSLVSHTSRRRVAESLGLPLETTRRHVARLMARGLVIEPRRGRLVTSGGVLMRASAEGLPLSLARRFLAVVRAFDRLGVLAGPEQDQP